MRILISTELDAEDRARIAGSFPDLEFVEGIGKHAALDSIAGCDVMFGSIVSADLLARADRLKWIHTRSAGVNSLPFEELSARGIIVTNSSGAHGIPIAENTLAMMLAFATGLHIFVAAQLRKEWNPPLIENRKFELEGQTLLVIGLGDLGETLALKANGLGMEVLGIRRRNLPSESVNELIPPDHLMEALPRADHIALCLPLTQETTGFFTESHFSPAFATRAG